MALPLQADQTVLGATNNHAMLQQTTIYQKDKGSGAQPQVTAAKEAVVALYTHLGSMQQPSLYSQHR